MNKLMYVFFIFVLNSCAKFVISDATYKRPYSLKFVNFYDDKNNVWQENLEGDAFSVSEDKYSLNYGSIAKNITAIFSITYNGSVIFQNAKLNFESIGLNSHFILNSADCSRRILQKNEVCYFSITYKYSKETDLNNIDFFNVLIKDTLDSSVVNENLFYIELKGHRKVLGFLVAETANINFGEQDFNIEPEAKLVDISYSGEFNIQSISAELIGQENLISLFNVSEYICTSSTQCQAKIKFPAFVGSGSAFGVDSVKLIYKVKMENDEYIDIEPITLEGKRRTETNLVVIDDNNNQISAINLDEFNLSKIFKIKNIGETKASNFIYFLNATSSFIFDTAITNSCFNGLVLNHNEECILKLNFIEAQSVGTYNSSIDIKAERIQSITIPVKGTVYEPAVLNIVGDGSFGSIVPNSNFTSYRIFTIKQSSGALPATLNNINLNSQDFFIDNSFNNPNKCENNYIFNNTDYCLVKIIFNPSSQSTYPSTINSTLVLTYNNGKNILANSSLSINGIAISDASLTSLNPNLEFSNIFYDENAYSVVSIKNNSGIYFNTINTFGEAGVEIDILSISISGSNAFEIENETCSKNSGNIVAPNATCNITIKFNPNYIKGNFSALLDINYQKVDASNINQTVSNLVANSIYPAILVLEPNPYNFGTIRYGIDEFKTHEFLLTNNGDTSASSVTNSIVDNNQDAFKLVFGTTCTETLVQNSSCIIKLEFSPGIELDQTINSLLNVAYKDRAQVSLVKNIIANISGTAVSFANIVSNINYINFGDTLINTSKEELITFTNLGYSSGYINSFIKTNDSISFSIEGVETPCFEGLTLNILDSCSIKVVFTPSNYYDLSLNDNIKLEYQSNSEIFFQKIDLEAVVLVPAKLSFDSELLSFANTEEGSVSNALEVNIYYEQGTVDTTINSILIEDNNSFSIINNYCEGFEFNSINSSCLIKVVFNPQLNKLGQINSNIIITYDRGYSLGLGTSSIAIEGLAVESNAVLNSNIAAVNFVNPVIRGVSGTELKTLTINKVSGNHNAIIQNINIGENFIIDQSATTCSTGYTFAAPCVIGVKFNPSINLQEEGQIFSSLVVNYDNRSGSGSLASINITLSGIVKKETILSFPDIVDFSDITQGNFKDKFFTYSVAQGDPRAITDQVIDLKVRCASNNTVFSNAFILQRLGALPLATCTSNCQINLRATAGIDKCTDEYDLLEAIYNITYNNGREQIIVPIQVTGNSLTPARLKFNSADIFSYNFDDYFCLKYNGSSSLCTNLEDENVFRGTLLYYSKTSSSTNLSILNIGESTASNIVSYKDANNLTAPFSFSSVNILGYNYNTNSPGSANINLTFNPNSEENHRRFNQNYLGIEYNDGTTVVKNSLNGAGSQGLLDNDKKINVLGTGLKYGRIKYLSESGPNCQNNICKFHNDDVIHYINSSGNLVNINNNFAYFKLVLEDADVPALIVPNNSYNGKSSNIFYFEPSFPGADGTCVLNMPIFNSSRSSFNSSCTIRVDFNFQNTCGSYLSPNGLVKFFPFQQGGGYTPPLLGIEDSYLQITSRPGLSIFGTNANFNYCDIKFGETNSAVYSGSIQIKNYTDETITIDFNNKNSYYTPSQTQNDFNLSVPAIPGSCSNTLNPGEVCKISFGFQRNIAQLGHVKYNWYNYRLPFYISTYQNNLDIRSYATTVVGAITNAESYIKKTKFLSNPIIKDANYLCYNCNDNTNEITLINTSVTQHRFSWTDIEVRTQANIWSSKRSLFNFNIEGGAFYTYSNLGLPVNLIDNELTYGFKPSNSLTFIQNLGTYYFNANNFNTFYGFTSTNNAPEFKIKYKTEYPVSVYFVGGNMQASYYAVSGNDSGTFIENIVEKYFVSKNQLIDMCQTMDYKLFNTNGQLYYVVDKVFKYLTDDFKTDCCSVELGIYNSLDQSFCY